MHGSTNIMFKTGKTREGNMKICPVGSETPESVADTGVKLNKFSLFSAILNTH